MKHKCLLTFALSLAALSGAACAETYYVDQARGNDAGAGGKDAPFKTVAHAVSLLEGKGGEVHLTPGLAPYREPIVIKKGGLPENPLVIDGHGAVVNLGLDVTKGPWIKTDDGYVLDHVFAKKIECGAYQSTTVFVNGLGILGDHPKGPSYAPRTWHGGYIRLDEQGRLVVVFPQGLTPENSVIVMVGAGDLTGETGGLSSGVRLESASNVVVRNLTSTFSTNDGFNFHGSGKNVRLEKVKAIFNADEGMSAHESYEVEVRDSETAFCGSQGGGVQDIGESVTKYINHRSHQNRAGGFQFDGTTYHRLEGVISYGNLGRNLPKPTPNIEIIDCQDSAPADKTIPTVADPAAATDPSKPVEESDRLGRFLQVRPPAL